MPEQERRNIQRSRILKSGRIFVSDKAPKIECSVRNLSETGAHVQVASGTFGIPDEFDLAVGNSRRHHCRVMWRTENRMGVKFN